MHKSHLDKIKRIAVIGGGPAGCFFSLLYLQKAREKGFSPEICVYNAKKFILGGPPGCNMCAGVIGKNLNILLRQLDVDISPVVQNVIEGYELHMLKGSVYISKDPGSRIFSVFRGGGPDPTEHRGGVSFDQLMLDKTVESGCRLYEGRVDRIAVTPDRRKIVVSCQGGEEEYDFLAGAFGVNSRPPEFFTGPDRGYTPPTTWHTCQAELRCGKLSWLQDKIHVFSLGMKHIKFITFTPKQEFVTISAVGPHVKLGDLMETLSHPRLKKYLPPETAVCCHCHPKLPVSDAKYPVGNRFVVIGDASYSRYLKNGIESAYRTAAFAVEAILERGISGHGLRAGYCKKGRIFFSRDNLYGKLLFTIHDIFSRNRMFSLIVLRRTAREKPGDRYFSFMFWNMFTGDRPYADIIKRMLSPYRMIRSIFPRRRYNGRP